MSARTAANSISALTVKTGCAAGVLLRSAESYGVKRIPTLEEFTDAVDREHLAAIKLTPPA